MSKRVFNIKEPAKQGNDKKDPFHGDVNVKKKSFVGVVVSDKMQRTVTVEWERRSFIKKYERYVKKKTKVHAHNPASINAREGDIVRIFQTRPIAKTVTFVVAEVLGKDKQYELEKESKAAEGSTEKKEEKTKSEKQSAEEQSTVAEEKSEEDEQ